MLPFLGFKTWDEKILWFFRRPSSPGQYDWTEASDFGHHASIKPYKEILPYWHNFWHGWRKKRLDLRVNETASKRSKCYRTICGWIAAGLRSQHPPFRLPRETCKWDRLFYLSNYAESTRWYFLLLSLQTVTSHTQNTHSPCNRGCILRIHMKFTTSKYDNLDAWDL